MASGYKSSIVFVTDNGIKSAEHFRDVSTLEDESQNYTQCEVSKLSAEGAVWIVYSESNFGRAGSGAGTSAIVYPSASGLLKPGFRIKSAQAFDITQPCMCLFEHSKYRGNKLATQSGVEDVRQQFPPGQVGGMSSSITTSGLWELWTRPAYNGARQEVDATQKTVENSLFEALNDQAQSVKLLRAS